MSLCFKHGSSAPRYENWQSHGTGWKQRQAERRALVIWEMLGRISSNKHAAAIFLGYESEANMTNESDRPVHTRFPLATDFNSDSARELGLDETLKETFPCSDALSAIPDPLLLEEST